MINLKKMLCSWLVLILIPVCLLGCLGQEPAKDKEQEPLESMQNRGSDLRSYFPIINGMMYNFLGEGNEYASFSREIKYVEKPFVQFYENNGGTMVVVVYKVAEDQILALFKQEEFYEDKNIIYEITEKDEMKELILKAPLKEGNSWITGKRRREIMSVNETLTVPAGTFYDVVKIKITSEEEPDSFENYEYYAENVGLIMLEFISQDLEVISQLQSYGMKEAIKNVSTLDKNQTQTELNEVNGIDLKEPDLALLAYQLDHQVRSSFQAAYESYINLPRITKDNEQKFSQIIEVLKNNIQKVAVNQIVEKQITKLQQLYKGGEGELTFPVYEVVEGAKVLQKNKDQAEVSLSIKKFFPEREWSGKSYESTFNYIIDIIKEEGVWKVKKVVSE